MELDVRKEVLHVCTSCVYHAPTVFNGKTIRMGCRTESGLACPFYVPKHNFLTELKRLFFKEN